MISDYANQSMTWKAVASLSEYNEPTYTTTTITGRKEPTSRLVRNAQGQEVAVSSFVVTASAVAVNDLIDNQQIIRVDSLPDLDGDIRFYEAYLI
jgi:hypothetical protein